MHVALRFAYDGSRFPAGYARQPGGGSVEDALMAALAGEGLVAGSWRTGSRTDKGVSAAENVAACELERPHLRGLVPATCAALPDGVWLTGAAALSSDWTPRHAQRRTYGYLSPDGGGSLRAMRDAARLFVGRHDMRAFARVDGRDPVRTVERFTVYRRDGWLRFTVTGPSFLWNQVRRMVGATLAVGTGALTPADIASGLASGTAPRRVPLAPAEGLWLQRVQYRPAVRWAPEAGSPGGSLVAWRQRQIVAAEVAAALRP